MTISLFQCLLLLFLIIIIIISLPVRPSAFQHVDAFILNLNVFKKGKWRREEAWTWKKEGSSRGVSHFFFLLFFRFTDLLHRQQQKKKNSIFLSLAINKVRASLHIATRLDLPLSLFILISIECMHDYTRTNTCTKKTIKRELKKEKSDGASASCRCSPPHH